MIDGVAASPMFTRLPSSRQACRCEGGACACGNGQAGKAVETGQGAQSTLEAERSVRELRKTDQKVRQHEQAHQTAGGPHAGSPQYQFVTGPDSRQYAVAGEVQIDISRESTSDATIRKMEIVKRAALAPADPSPQDLRVAQQADAIAAQARSEQRKGDDPAETGGAGDRPEGGRTTPSGATPSGTAPSAAARRGVAAYGAASVLGAGAASGISLVA